MTGLRIARLLSIDRIVTDRTGRIGLVEKRPISVSRYEFKETLDHEMPVQWNDPCRATLDSASFRRDPQRVNAFLFDNVDLS